MKPQSLIRLAFAENHTIVRAGITGILHSADKFPVRFKVEIEADNGKELIDKLEKAKKIPDVCILDLYMPEMGARETMPILKKRWPGMGILILTVEEKQEVATEMIEKGAQGYLLKNCSPLTLKSAIEAIRKGAIYYEVNMTVSNTVRKENVIPHNLNATELQIIKLLHEHPEMTWEQMGHILYKSPKSIDRYKQSIYNKLDVHSRAELVKYVIEHGLV